MLGTITSGPRTAPITAKESQRYAQAVGDLNPVYFDEEAARAAGYDGLVCPPTFLDHVTVEGRPLGELRPDGLFTAAERSALAMDRVMFGGQEWDFLAPAHVGDTITATSASPASTRSLAARAPSSS
jgi:acyl dehydratase